MASSRSARHAMCDPLTVCWANPDACDPMVRWGGPSAPFAMTARGRTGLLPRPSRDRGCNHMSLCVTLHRARSRAGSRRGTHPRAPQAQQVCALQQHCHPGQRHARTPAASSRFLRFAVPSPADPCEGPSILRAGVAGLRARAAADCRQNVPCVSGAPRRWVPCSIARWVHLARAAPVEHKL